MNDVMYWRLPLPLLCPVVWVDVLKPLLGSSSSDEPSASSKLPRPRLSSSSPSSMPSSLSLGMLVVDFIVNNSDNDGVVGDGELFFNISFDDGFSE